MATQVLSSISVCFREENASSEGRRIATQQETWDTLGEPEGKLYYLLKYTPTSHWGQPVGEPYGWGDESEHHPRKGLKHDIEFGRRRQPRFVKPQQNVQPRRWQLGMGDRRSFHNRSTELRREEEVTKKES